MVIIQEILTTWTKTSRGAPGAVARGKVPERMSFAAAATESAILEHMAYFNEHGGFVARETTQQYAAPATLAYGCTRLQVEVDRVAVTWRYDSGYIGAPGRDGSTKEVFVVRPGQWGRVRYNGRLTEDEGWWYRKIVLNVGIFASGSGSEFLANEPDFTYDQMARLW
jgi:hypothetical protein